MTREQNLLVASNLRTEIFISLVNAPLDGKDRMLLDELIRAMSLTQLRKFYSCVKQAMLEFKEEIIDLAVSPGMTDLLAPLSHVTIDPRVQLPSREVVYDLTEHGIDHLCDVSTWDCCTKADKRQNHYLNELDRKVEREEMQRLQAEIAEAERLEALQLIEFERLQRIAAYEDQLALEAVNDERGVAAARKLTSPTAAPLLNPALAVHSEKAHL